MFTHCIAVAFGRIEAADAQTFGVVHIDRFHASTHTSYAFQMPSTIQKRTVDNNFATHHKGVVLVDLTKQRVVVHIGLHLALMACCFQLLLQHRMGRIGKKNSHFFVDL